jgi:hypothetical protein
MVGDTVPLDAEVAALAQVDHEARDLEGSRLIHFEWPPAEHGGELALQHEIILGQ